MAGSADEIGTDHIFVSYSHLDLETIGPDLEWLRSQGHKLWVDEQIHAGADWANEIAVALERCVALIFYASRQSAASPHCLNEVAYAVSYGKKIFCFYVEDIQLTGGLKLSLSRTQAILRWHLSEDEYRQQVRHVLAHEIGVEVEVPLRTKVKLLPSRNPHFTGREATLDEVGELVTGGYGAIVFKGLAGLGKSQLALEYAHRVADRYRFVAWVRAESSSTLDADFVSIAHELSLPNADDADVALVVESVKSWLQKNDNWLVVLDNAEDPELLGTYLPSDARGQILVTSRRAVWTQEVRGYPVEPFSEDEAIAFIENRTGTQNSASELAAALGYLPLALEEAVAYIEETGRSVQSYLQIFASHHSAVMSHSHPVPGYNRTLRATLELSLRQIEKTESSASRLISLLAFLGPDGVPLNLLEGASLGGDDLPNELVLDTCVAALRRFSLIKVENEAVSVHRLLQLVVRDGLSKEDWEEYALSALRLIDKRFPSVSDMGNRGSDCRKLLPHALAAIDYAQEIESASEMIGLLLGRTGTYLSARSNSDQAIAQTEKAYRTFESRPHAKRELGRMAELHARVLYHEGHLDRASEVFFSALKAYEGSAGSAIRAMQVHTDLAWIDWTAGKFESAKRYCDMSLASLTEAREKDSRVNDLMFTSLSGSSLSIKSRLCLELGQIGEARDNVERAIQSIEVLGGFRMPLMVGVFLQVGQVLNSLGWPLRAQSWAQESLGLGRPFFSEYHALIAASHCVLGQALVAQGELDEAAQQFDAGAEAGRRTSRPVNQHIGISECYLASTLIELGETKEASWIVDHRFDALLENAVGDTALVVGMSDLVRGQLASVQGRHDDALAYCVAGNKGFEKRYGGQHIHRILPLILLGSTQRQANKVSEAEQSFATGLRIGEDAGLNHPLMARCLLEMARLNTDEEIQEALYNRAVEILNGSIGPSTPRIIERYW